MQSVPTKAQADQEVCAVAKRNAKLDDWEVSLVKAMLATGKYRKQEIHSYFSRQGRTINQARISQIASGVIQGDVPAATDAQLSAFLANYDDPAVARRKFLEEDPLHPSAAKMILHAQDGTTPTIGIEENDWTEFKETFGWNSRAAYARTIAAFANNRGGYLVFGVHDESKHIVGLSSDSFKRMDPAVISQYLNQHFAPAIRWQMETVDIFGKSVGLIYVWQAENRPVICTQNHDPLKSADIYYRYVGYSSRINTAELLTILSERDDKIERKWMETMRHIRHIGIDNTAVLDTSNGVVKGPGGSFVIDEALLPKLKFIREGHFSEDSGAPALKLVGEVEPIRGAVGTETGPMGQVPLSDRELIAAFIEQREVHNPKAYIRQLCHVQPKWMPLYYYMSSAKIGPEEAIAILEEEPTSYPARKTAQIDRLRAGQCPVKPSTHVHRKARERLLNKESFDTSDPHDAKKLLVAIQTLSRDEIDQTHIFPLLRECFDKHYGGENSGLTGDIRHAATQLDCELWKPREES
ncbi:hypothetical protein GAY33_01285 [Azospirillum brasilense]|nr:hypothetical protein [Azospirillum argentinense]